MNENSQLPQPDAAPRRAFWRRPWFWLGLVVLGLAAWQWWAAQTRLEKSRQELTRRLAESEKAARDSQLLLSRAMAQTEALQQKYGALAAKMEEFQGEAEALRGLYQEAALTRDDALLAEVEQNIN
ncbi:MAG: hypothetical protein LBS89_07200, partial [Zoogloeaceae bacterium]|nr:hypothetical protein [Zoogloeaceae bacterium]